MRNPCLFFRFRLRGLYVGFMKEPLSGGGRRKIVANGAHNDIRPLAPESTLPRGRRPSRDGIPTPRPAAATQTRA